MAAFCCVLSIRANFICVVSFWKETFRSLQWITKRWPKLKHEQCHVITGLVVIWIVFKVIKVFKVSPGHFRYKWKYKISNKTEPLGIWLFASSFLVDAWQKIKRISSHVWFGFSLQFSDLDFALRIEKVWRTPLYQETPKKLNRLRAFFLQPCMYNYT